MKRKSFIWTVLAAAVAAAVVAAVSFAAGGGKSSSGITMHLIEKDQAFHYVDNPPVSTPQEHFASQGEGGTSKIAIVGGTGAYEGAKGSAVSVSKPNGNTSRDTIHLILP